MGEASRVALVTGGARGIGWATAEAFLAAGWRVVLCDIDGAEAGRRAEEHPQRILPLGLDVADRSAVEKTFTEVIRQWGRLDAVVNNAGIQRHAPLEELAPQDWLAVLDVNLHGTFHCLQAAGRIMLPQGAGAIVNLASVAATRGAPGRAPYAASKAAIVSLTKTAAVEWSARGVRVNAVAPGYVETDLVKSAIANGRISLDPILQRIPAGRLATPAEIAGAIVFLCSDGASYVTGHVLHVDGGFEADYGVPFSQGGRA
ncbi:MAG: SDR family oxidoreductase [Rhizobiaceae bacterium]|nr:SDR family oxidoreductase [Rhizobiaceae bacterium]